jgi:hypothetical protein
MPTQEEIDKIVPVLSSDRFRSFKQVGEPDHHTLARVNWNTALSEAAYPCLQALEVALRNRLNQTIAAVCDDPNWIITAAFMKPPEAEMIDAAKKGLSVRGRPITAGYMIAELKFGFWTSLADVRYDKMWHKIIKPIFPQMPNTIRTRAEVSKRLHVVRRFRNAVSHHHSIWHWADLERQHMDICTLLIWIEPSYAAWVKHHDRFPAVYAAGYLAFI